MSSPTLPTPLPWMAEQLRALVREAVRGRVAGRTGERTARELAERDDDGWFGPDSPVWQVHADASMLVGGVRAILLQSLHPLAMAGVAEHSDYRTDPWGRLQRTADFLARTTFGSTTQAAAACTAVRAVHRRVRGVAPDGRPYDANDPHLLRWVHVAEVDSFLVAHDRFGSRRLSPAERDGYVAGMARVAIELGASGAPSTVAELRQALAEYRPELRATRAAREAVRFLAFPPLPLAAQAPYGALFAAGASLLPLWVRRELRLPWFPVSETVVLRPLAAGTLEVLRWAMSGDDRRPSEVVARAPAAPGPGLPGR